MKTESDLLSAAQAVVDRWDSPKWSWQTHTGDLIAELRRCLAAHQAAEKVEPNAFMFTNVQSGDVEVSTDPDAFDGTMWHRQPLFTRPPCAESSPLQPSGHEAAAQLAAWTAAMKMARRLCMRYRDSLVRDGAPVAATVAAVSCAISLREWQEPSQSLLEELLAEAM